MSGWDNEWGEAGQEWLGEPAVGACVVVAGPRGNGVLRPPSAGAGRP